jgi:hypothetical protein
VAQSSQTIGVELVGLVDVVHHRLGLSSVSEQGQAARLFNLVLDPIPGAHRSQGHGALSRELGEEGPDRPALVVHTGALHAPTLRIHDREERVGLVSVTTDRIMRLLRHVAPPGQTDGEYTISVAGGAVLSYHQLTGADLASPDPWMSCDTSPGLARRLSSMPLGLTPKSETHTRRTER